MKTLLYNAYIITMNKNIISNGYVLYEDDIILEVGDGVYKGVSDIQEDMEQAIILPGFINTHVHLMQQLGRGIADDVSLLTWLTERVWTYESSLTESDAYISSKACCVELAKCGVTTFLEAGGEHIPMMHKAVTEVGLKATLTYNVMDTGEGLPSSWVKDADTLIDIQKKFIEQYTSNNIQIALGIRTIFNATYELLQKTAELSAQENILVNAHVLEVDDELQFTLQKFNKSTIKVFDEVGLLSNRLVAAHCVWLDDEDIQLFKKNNVSVSYNPSAAMKVVLGFARIDEMIEEGINVTLGTDGAPSNNRMDIMRDMYLASLLTKGKTLNPLTVNAYQVLEMATINGAKALHIDDMTGSIEKGKKADLVILRLDDIHTNPVYNVINSIVYSATSSNIIRVVSNGITILKDGVITTVDEQTLIKQIKQSATKFQSIVGGVHERDN